MGPRAPAGLPSSARGGLRPAGRASRRSTGGCSGGDGATTVAVAGKGEQKGRRTTGKVVAHAVSREGARGSGDTAAASSAMADVAAHGVTPRERKKGRVRSAEGVSRSGGGASATTPA